MYLVNEHERKPNRKPSMDDPEAQGTMETKTQTEDIPNKNNNKTTQKTKKRSNMDPTKKNRGKH